MNASSNRSRNMKIILLIICTFMAEIARAQGNPKPALFDVSLGVAGVYGAHYKSSFGPSIDAGLAFRRTHWFARLGARGQVGPPTGDNCVRESLASPCLRQLPTVCGISLTAGRELDFVSGFTFRLGIGPAISWVTPDEQGASSSAFGGIDAYVDAVSRGRFAFLLGLRGALISGMPGSAIGTRGLSVGMAMR